MADKIISRFADTTGDGSGNKQATGNYSSAPETFLIKPSGKTIYTLHRMIINVADTVGMQAEEYGNLGAALTNGISVAVYNSSGLLYNLTDPDYPVKSNAGWSYMCYDAHLLTWGSGDEMLNVRWTFSRTGVPVVLRAWEGEYLEIKVNDNLTGLLYHAFLIQGYESTQV
jgi:hypothetical protein